MNRAASVSLRRNFFAALAAVVWSTCPAAATSQPALTAVPVPAAPAPYPLERAGVSDPAGYTVIAPIFLGGNQNYSYIRFPNGGTETATFNVTLVGSPTARNYGTLSLSVPRFSSPQYGVLDFFKTLGLTSFGPGDTGVSLYIQSPQGGNHVGFQHVVWNSTTGFFENASVCAFKPAVDYSGLSQALFNVHTSIVRGYPGTVFLHNYSPTETAYRANVYDASNGAYLGGFSMSAPANATVSMDMSAVEKAIAFTPGPNQYHVNIQFLPPPGGAWNAIASVAINDQQIQAYTNMSMVCSVNP
jgi:hypothetical protein